MFRLRSKSGDESVFRSPEEIRSALLSGFVTPDAQIWDAELKGWVPLLEHALYQQISASPGGRKSGSVKGPPAGPAAPKTPPKLVIKRPGATTAIPAVKPPIAPPPPAPVAQTPKVVEEASDFELLDLDMTPEPELVAPAAPAPKATPAAPPPAVKRPTPPPPPSPAPPVQRSSAPRVSAPRPAQTEEEKAPAPAFMRHTAETAAASGSKVGVIIAAVVVLAAAGGGFFMLRGRGSATPPADSTAAAVPPVHVAAADSGRDTTQHQVADTTKHDSTAAPAPATAATPAPAETTHVAAAAPAHPADTASAPAGIEPVPFAPLVERGATSWNARPLPPAPLSVPALEVVRSRYAAAQARASQQYEASLEVAEFADMFDPAKVARGDKRQAAFDAIDAARGALRDFRRKQAALDFAYTDSLRRALPPGSDDPDLRTFGPILRESPAQAALTDSLVAELVDMYGLLINEAGGYTFKAGALVWKDGDNAAQYRADQERLTAQLARIRTRSPSDVPPAMAGILRGIGLPR